MRPWPQSQVSDYIRQLGPILQAEDHVTADADASQTVRPAGGAGRFAVAVAPRGIPARPAHGPGAFGGVGCGRPGGEGARGDRGQLRVGPRRERLAGVRMPSGSPAALAEGDPAARRPGYHRRGGRSGPQEAPWSNCRGLNIMVAITASSLSAPAWFLRRATGRWGSGPAWAAALEEAWWRWRWGGGDDGLN